MKLGNPRLYGMEMSWLDFAIKARLIKKNRGANQKMRLKLSPPIVDSPSLTIFSYLSVCNG